jgi:D-alanyl-D-alanine carboxypeptidase
VAMQRRLLGDADSALTTGRQQMSAAARHQQELRAAAAQAAASRVYAGALPGADNRVTGEVGDCAGGEDVAQYANGQIPLGALCPLTADPRQHLRADAAYAFDRLTFAYVQRFGAPPCITDSYRSYAAQVDVYARKPGLAAVPGTSNHGWGTALDLCGGVESFTGDTHRWMLLNAPLYGWFHPSWAEPAGSRPEPWHWEYSG